MAMFNPPHPGEIIEEVYLDELNVPTKKAASQLAIDHSALLRLLKGESNIDAEMALRLSKCLGRSPESWLILQNNYDLFHAKNNTNIDLTQVKPLVLLLAAKAKQL